MMTCMGETICCTRRVSRPVREHRSVNTFLLRKSALRQLEIVHAKCWRHGKRLQQKSISRRKGVCRFTASVADGNGSGAATPDAGRPLRWRQGVEGGPWTMSTFGPYFWFQKKRILVAGTFFKSKVFSLFPPGRRKGLISSPSNPAS
eukprot:jgi/Botrbrau1/22328/Bobra.0002s0008.1